MKIWALSGFLGLPEDWEILQWQALTGIDWQNFSLDNLNQWAKDFNQWIDWQKGDYNILFGYSLGGRMALHALIDYPKLWQAAVIISAHAGLTNKLEREMRLEQDRIWAKRFESEDWEEVIKAWNNQEIFSKESFCFKRQESNYQRAQLKKALVHCSLGRQANLRTQIANLPMPILWLTGGQDLRYCQIAQTLAFSNPNSYWGKIEGAGHRVPWSQPQKFLKNVMAFFQKIHFY